MVGRQVCCILGVCMVGIREQIIPGFLYPEMRGLYRFDEDGREDVTQKARF